MSHPSERNWVELGAMLLLALAAVATAWSSYQASRWNGEQAKVSGRVNKTRIEAARASDRANAETEIDVETFIQWIDARAQDKTELASFYRTRFRKEFQPAFNAWLATKPLQTEGAPLTPFTLPQYRLAATAEAERLDAEADVLSAQVHRNINRATHYVLCVVLFAVSLFFAGMSTKLSTPGLRKGMLAMGFVVFVATAVWVVTSPVSIGL